MLKNYPLPCIYFTIPLCYGFETISSHILDGQLPIVHLNHPFLVNGSRRALTNVRKKSFLVRTPDQRKSISLTQDFSIYQEKTSGPSNHPLIKWNVLHKESYLRPQVRPNHPLMWWNLLDKRHYLRPQVRQIPAY